MKTKKLKYEVTKKIHTILWVICVSIFICDSLIDNSVSYPH
jgi:hypothetical protein